jgi:2-polyprenyl-3-methyl-5-hydroxy-6-metoxy-1,4-benzoquinol methylase
VTLLDIATGSADLPIAAVRWARKAGFDLRVTGIDLHATTLELAREHLGRNRDVADAITLEPGDALRLSDRFAARSFDYVHAGLFLHHLSDLEALTVLSIMDKLARAGIVWNDLPRTRIALGVTYLITLPTPAIVRHDATVSVRAGFSRDEVVDMARRLELAYAKYHLDFGAQRFTLAGEKPGAWA